MTRLQRKLLLINGVLGTTLTLMVLLLDRVSVLEPLENWFYDRRALYCQFFRKPPTDRLVFVEIDDPALDTIGRWPWDRSTVATLLDEISAAHPQLIFLDILYTERQKPSEETLADQTKVLVEQDPPMAAAIHRAANVLVPLSLDLEEALRPKSPADQAICETLEADLELTPDQVAQRLLARGIGKTQLGADFEFRFVGIRRAAMFNRIDRELTNNPSMERDGLRKRLLPRTDERFITSPLLRLLDQELDKKDKLLPIERFSRAKRPDDPPLIEATDESAPLAIFSREAGGSGFVNYLPGRDGVIRAVPLLVSHHGRVVPQIGLVIACRLLGVDPNNLRVSGSEIVIPRSGGDIHIPIATHTHDATGSSIGALCNVPYIGGRQWETMFDPARKSTSQNVPIMDVWKIGQTRELISINNATADRALLNLTARLLGEEDAKQLAARKLDPFDARTRAVDIHSMLDRLAETIKQYKTAPPTGDGALTPKEKEELADLEYEQSGLRRLLDENELLASQLVKQRVDLRSRLADKAVFIGSIATGTSDDLKPTALHAICPGMLVHGTIANGILSGELWREAPRWLTYVITLFMGLATTLFVLRLATRKAAIATFSLGIAYLLINGLLVFDYFNVIVGVAGPMVAILLCWVSCQLVEIVIEKIERNRITRRFSTYVDPALVDYVIEHADEKVTEGQEREMTVVFTDLAGFTTISEALKEKVIPLLNEYLGLMSSIIKKHNGLVNKFLGDGIMFFFNAPRNNPNHAVDAVETVLEMQKELVGFNAGLLKRGLPAITMRAGITTGSMVVGDAGGQGRSDYTVIGDNVNLAARLESANKATDTKVMMTARTVELLNGQFLVRPTARLQVKGKTEGVDTCELIARTADATEEQRRKAELGKAVFDAFVKSDFAACLKAVEAIEKELGETKLTKAYQELSEQYLKEPPGDDFDGQIVLHEK